MSQSKLSQETIENSPEESEIVKNANEKNGKLVNEKKITYNWIPESKTNNENVDSGLADKYSEVEKGNDPLLCDIIEEEKEIVYFDPLRKKEITAPKDVGFSDADTKYKIFKVKKVRGELSWEKIKAKILDKYRTDKTLPIYSSILAQRVDEESVTFENKIKQRLSMLSSGSDRKMITQKKYIKFLEELNEELKRAWGDADRVHALKIVIKCTKMLSKTIVPEFYPSMFVIVCEVMDTFGDLVFGRIKKKATIKDRYTGKICFKLPENFSGVQVPSRAKEICKNWFFKISSIRELIARIYVEIMIVKSRKYLIKDFQKEMLEEFKRLTLGVRGIGDILVSNYARFFIAKKVFEIIEKDESLSILLLLNKDFLLSLKDVKTSYLKRYFKKVDLNEEEYVNLLIPPIEWIIKCVGKCDVTNEVFKEFLETYLTHCTLSKEKKKEEGEEEEKERKVTYNVKIYFPKLLSIIIMGFPSHLINENYEKVLDLINQLDEDSDKLDSYIAIGIQLNKVEKFNKENMVWLKKIFEFMDKLELLDYLSISKVWIEFVVKNYGLKKCNKMMEDVYKRIILKDSKILFDKYEYLIKDILLVMLENSSSNLKEILSLKHFFGLFDLLKNENFKVKVCKCIFYILKRKKKIDGLKFDQVIINSLFEMGTFLHNHVNYLTSKKEFEVIEDLITSFINKIEHEDNDKQIEFFINCRKNFNQFENSLIFIIFYTFINILLNCNNKDSDDGGGGGTTKKRINKTLVKKYQAFIHVSIPSISSLNKDNVMVKINIYIFASQVCLNLNLLPQAEQLLKQSIKLISRIPQFSIISKDDKFISNDIYTVQIINNILSTLVAFPGHPKFGPFFLIKILLNAIENYHWNNDNNQMMKVKCYINTLTILQYLFYSKLPYSFNNLEIKNTDLFIQAKIEKEAKFIVNTILKQIIENLEKLIIKVIDPLMKIDLFLIILDFFNVILFRCKGINDKVIFDENLQNVIKKYYRLLSNTKESKVVVYLNNTLKCLRTKNEELYNKLF